MVTDSHLNKLSFNQPNRKESSNRIMISKLMIWYKTNFGIWFSNQIDIYALDYILNFNKDGK